ncbi:MAG: hypothetical protein N2447_03935 [Thermoanaerobaculum sp.]|nr:hypothetical protein [Thermoanaerobaculum sp.]
MGLYLIWRLAVVAGKRREAEYRRISRALGKELGLCQRCGVARNFSQLKWRGFGPFAKLVCREGCEGKGGDEPRS